MPSSRPEPEFVPLLTVLRQERVGGYWRFARQYGVDAKALWRLEHGASYRETSRLVQTVERVFGLPIQQLLERVPNPKHHG